MLNTDDSSLAFKHSLGSATNLLLHPSFPNLQSARSVHLSSAGKLSHFVDAFNLFTRTGAPTPTPIPIATRGADKKAPIAPNAVPTRPGAT